MSFLGKLPKHLAFRPDSYIYPINNLVNVDYYECSVVRDNFCNQFGLFTFFVVCLLF